MAKSNSKSINVFVDFNNNPLDQEQVTKLLRDLDAKQNERLVSMLMQGKPIANNKELMAALERHGVRVKGAKEEDEQLQSGFIKISFSKRGVMIDGKSATNKELRDALKPFGISLDDIDEEEEENEDLVEIEICPPGAVAFEKYKVSKRVTEWMEAVKKAGDAMEKERLELKYKAAELEASEKIALAKVSELEKYASELEGKLGIV